MDPDLQDRWVVNSGFDSPNTHVCKLGLSAASCGSARLVIHGAMQMFGKESSEISRRANNQIQVPRDSCYVTLDLTCKVFVVFSSLTEGISPGNLSQPDAARYLLLIC